MDQSTFAARLAFHEPIETMEVDFSNFAFADSSVRLLGYGKSINPLNLWAVTDTWRNTPIDPDAN